MTPLPSIFIGPVSCNVNRSGLPKLLDTPISRESVPTTVSKFTLFPKIASEGSLTRLTNWPAFGNPSCTLRNAEKSSEYSILPRPKVISALRPPIDRYSLPAVSTKTFLPLYSAPCIKRLNSWAVASASVLIISSSSNVLVPFAPKTASSCNLARRVDAEPITRIPVSR